MKYNYKKSMLVLQWIILACLYVTMIGLVYCFGANERFLKKAVWGAGGFFFFMVATYSKEFTNRYVELQDNSIRFNSFRFKNVKMKNTVSFGVNYEDVLAIDIRKLPLIGIWAISINAKSLPQKITISFCFIKHKELYSNLCKLVKQHNSSAYIDSCLVEFLERK